MQNDIDWRHILGAVILVGLLIFSGFKIANRPPELPRAQAPAGPNARTADAPEHATPPAPGLPTAQ